MVSPPILTYPDFKVPFIVSTDPSGTTIGGVLSQVQKGSEKVIAYWSHQLQKAERKYSTVEQEALAVVCTIKEFYPYLYGFPFTVITDHNPLISLKGIKDTGGRLTRWLMFLQQFNFENKYKKGSQHNNADALSRQPPISTLTCDSTLLASTDELIESQQENPQLSLICNHFEQGTPFPKCPPGLWKCFIYDGILCRSYKESSTSTVHVHVLKEDTIMRETHGLVHLGIKKPLYTIRTRFYRPGYKKDVEYWVK